MVLPIVWSPEAVEDLESIVRYISRDSGSYARSVVTEILKKSKALSDFPNMGRRVPEIGDDQFREQIIYSYRLVYRVKQDSILIIGIIHGSRMLDSIQDRF